MDVLDPATPDDMTLDLATGAPRLEAGSPQPLGANWTGRGTNFAVFSAHADRVELCLFDGSGREEIARLDLPSRTGNLWHGFLPARFGGPGLQYGYRVHGPYDPARGLRFNPSKLLVDPCAQSLRGLGARRDELVARLADLAEVDPLACTRRTSMTWDEVRQLAAAPLATS